MLTIQYLNSLASKEYIAQKPGLGRIRKLLKYLGNPQDKYPLIHIAGTNGKGSTATIICEILKQAGYRVGLYTSPHLVSYRERIRIGDTLVSDKEVSKLLKIASAAGGRLLEKLTYFELLTAVAFMYFARENADFVVCETGLGGRYDATNVVKKPVLSIITSIDFDHMEYLGNTIEEIAGEKAGIIKKNVPVVANVRNKSAGRVVFGEGRKKHTEIYSLGKQFRFKSISTDWARLEQKFSYCGIEKNYENLSLKLLGKHQLINASLAIAGTELLSVDIPESVVRRALKKAYWPGRFEIIKSKPTVILDGAHNPEGAMTLKNILSEYPLRKGSLVIAMSILKEKDYKKICRILSFVADRVVIFKANTIRALGEEVLVNEWRKYLPSKKITVADDFNRVLRQVKRTEVLCVAGSLYAIGDAIKYLKNHKISVFNSPSRI